jgi:hypothetical protein
MGRPPGSFGSSNLSSALTSRPGPMGSARAAWAPTIQSGHARCCQPSYVPCPPYGCPQHGEAPRQLRQLQLKFGPHVPTGADGFGTRGMGANHPIGPRTLLPASYVPCPPYGCPQHGEAPRQLRQLQLKFGPHVPTGADGFGTRGMGANHPIGPRTLLTGSPA